MLKISLSIKYQDKPILFFTFKISLLLSKSLLFKLSHSSSLES